jgi:RNA polymerase sigma-70 factor (ECF subfamily)
LEAHSPARQEVRPSDGDPATSLDVAALTRRMVAGNEDAYRKFYDAYFDRLARYLLVVTSGNEEVMRDVLQATFVRVVRSIKVFPDDTQLWRWLTVIARNAFHDETRKHKRYFAFLDRFTRHARTEQEVNAAEPSDPLQSLLESAVALLPADERLLVERKYFERRSVRDIAAELEITEKAVEARLVRVRRKVKEVVLTALKDESSH